MYRVLVPGGWVNLTETLMDVLEFRWTPGPATTKLFMLARNVFLARGIIPDIPRRLPTLLEEAGFVNIHAEEHGLTLYGQDGADMRDNTHRGLLGMKTPLLKTGELKSEEEYDSLVSAASKEWSEIPEAVAEVTAVYAQKPPSWF
jgi:hypothetical protein